MNVKTASANLKAFKLLCWAIVASGSVPTTADVFSPEMNNLLQCYQGKDKAHKAVQEPLIYDWNKAGIYQDTKGDAIFEFVDLTELKVSVSDENIVVIFSLAHIPHVLVFDQHSVPDDALEYDWSVYFDLDESSTDELSIAMSSYKNSDVGESLQNSLVSTQKDVWLISDTGGQVVTTNVEANYIDRHTFSLTVSKSESELLKQITKNTPVRFSAVYNFSGRECQDNFPD